MCGVFGYVGQDTNAGETIVSALKTLEYRGYDSWGLALSTAGGLVIEKQTGRINGQCVAYPPARSGIGHTRWATHGAVTRANAHPHLDRSQRVAVVHNGIIENHAILRAELQGRGTEFASETDSEIVAHLVAERLAEGCSLPESVARVFDRLAGYNAIVVLDRDCENFVAAKRVSPLVIGRGPDASTIASDAVALHGHADELIYLEDAQLALVSSSEIQILDRATLRAVTPFTAPMPHTKDDVSRGQHADFMSKEIAEQPAALRRLARESQAEIAQLAGAVVAAKRVILVGCGTAANAALAGTYLFGSISGRDVSAIPASEFLYRSQFLDSDALVVAISQSGETLDVIEAIVAARTCGARLGAIVNVPNSTVARLAESCVHLRSGVEQCVLATKSYTAMLAALVLTAHAASARQSAGEELVGQAATALESMLAGELPAQANRVAARIAASDHLFTIGRGLHFPSALEAALKIKEVSYVHAEGFAGGELKHGVIALIEAGTPCLVFAPDDETRTDILSGAMELKSRGGYMIGVGRSADSVFDEFIDVPTLGVATAIVEALPGQLLGYHAALARGNDPDRPRNLAKSVTVK